MDDAKLEQVRAWLLKAQRDLGAAERLASPRDPYLDVAVFHCQQAAEKSLKAYLTHHDIRFGKTHDLSVLVQQAVALGSSFAACFDAAELLTPYAVMFRYPGDVEDPGTEEFVAAFEAARFVFDLVCQSLPEAARS